ncbi:uncharacterized protein LOC134067195 isoform X1 [Sardina pilchardus]|uniref:uncharacterized protein LOC134067195 isoform X1 n=2 Tax=Sardina pilchardus TaxID=27697 RepID=UPI002E1167F0
MFLSAAEQMFFQLYSEVEQYLRFRTYKPDKKDRKRIKRASKKFLWKDECLWHFDGRRERKVVRDQEEVKAVLQQYHNDKIHKSVGKVLKEVAGRFYWGSTTKDIKKWIDNCARCKQTRRKPIQRQKTMHCICYGCESSLVSNGEDEGLAFHRFPSSDSKRRELWISYAKRDHWSLTPKSVLCSLHFTDDCFDYSEEGIPLKSDAVPNVPMPSDGQQESNEDDIDPFTDLPSLEKTEHIEHPYAIDSERGEMANSGDQLWENDINSRKELPFSRYDAVERYLRTGSYTKETCKKMKYIIRRASKLYRLEDDVLYYCRRNKRRRVLRSRAQVNAVLREFHDNQGHYATKRCITAVAEEYHWGTLMRDVEMWIGNCQFCLNMDESSQKFHCCVNGCKNHNGPVERTLGLTFHRFPFDDRERLSQWIKNTHKSKWSPLPRSTVCSNHFTEDCFERVGKEKLLKSHAVPTLSLGQPQLEAAEGSDAENNSETIQKTFFSKYDAVHKYLSTRVYPPGLNAVEKNTLRRLCTRFAVHDGILFFTTKRNRRRVVRNKEDVQATLTMYHNEMNHLDVDKCTTLISKHFHWGSLKPDVQRWIQRCEECAAARAPPPEPCASAASPECSDPEDVRQTQVPSPSAATDSASPAGGDVEPSEAVALSEVVETVHQGSGTPWHLAVKRSDPLDGASLPPNKRRKDGDVLPVIIALQSYQVRLEDSLPAREKFEPLRARTVLQLCSQAIIQTQKETKDDNASYTRIDTGLVIYLTFFDATEEIIPKMVRSLLQAKLFPVRGREPSSVLDLPGSVLIVPQDSLTGTLKDNKFQYLQRIDASHGQRLYNSFVSLCERALASSSRCVEAKCVVKHGVYGQKQSIFLNSEEPLTHIVEF